MAITHDDIDNFIGDNEVRLKFFDWIATRKRHTGRVTVDNAMKITEATSRREVIELFKGLAELQLARFIKGAHGHSTRIVWLFDLIRIRDTYLNDDEVLIDDELDDDDFGDDDFDDDDDCDDSELIGMTKHLYVLRNDSYPIEIYLPDDLTSREAERLARFIQTLPVDDD